MLSKHPHTKQTHLFLLQIDYSNNSQKESNTRKPHHLTLSGNPPADRRQKTSSGWKLGIHPLQRITGRRQALGDVEAFTPSSESRAEDELWVMLKHSPPPANHGKKASSGWCWGIHPLQRSIGSEFAVY